MCPLPRALGLWLIRAADYDATRPSPNYNNFRRCAVGTRNMNQEAYENFVARIELEADRHPVLYRVRLSGMAVLGYAYVALILSLLLASLLVLSWMVLRGSGAAIAIKLGILVIPLV